MRVLGLDPGKHGGWAVHDGTTICCAGAFPLVAGEIDWQALSLSIGAAVADLAVIEKVGAMPKQGIASAFTFGYTTGKLDGLITARQVPLVAVTPQRWKKVVLDGLDKGDKNVAIQYALKRYPHINLFATPKSRVAHDGIADACCIAEYGARTHGLHSTPRVHSEE